MYVLCLLIVAASVGGCSGWTFCAVIDDAQAKGCPAYTTTAAIAAAVLAGTLGFWSFGWYGLLFASFGLPISFFAGAFNRWFSWLTYGPAVDWIVLDTPADNLGVCAVVAAIANFYTLLALITVAKLSFGWALATFLLLAIPVAGISWGIVILLIQIACMALFLVVTAAMEGLPPAARALTNVGSWLSGKLPCGKR